MQLNNMHKFFVFSVEDAMAVQNNMAGLRELEG